MNRLLRLCLVSCMAFAVACGGNNDENNTNNSSNSMTNNASNNANNTNNSNNSNNTSNNANNTNNQPGSCAAVGDTCDPAADAGANFVCVEEVCRRACDPMGDNSECQAGSLCGQTDGGAPYCIPSDCNGWLDDSCPAGQQCVAFVNEADLCTGVGMLADGDACEATEADPFPCGPGLFCGFGECTAICGADSDCDEAGGERCIQDTLDNGVGICGVGCDSYSFGQCPAGQGCFPVTEVDGICDDVGTVAPYSPCDDTNTCGEGTACIGFQSADMTTGATDVSRCLPFCNPTLGTAVERNDTCPQPGNAMGYGRFAHLAEGAGMVDVYVDGTLEVDDLAFEAVSANGAFLPLTVGMHTVEVTAFDDADNSTPLLTVNADVTAQTVVTWALVPDATTTVAAITVPVPRGEAAPAAGSAKLRPVHAIPDFGAVDVVAVPAGAADFAAEVELALNLAPGAAAASFTEVPAADYDIYLFPAGTNPRTTANATGVTVAGVTVPGDVTVSVYARGTVDGSDGADPGLTNVAYSSAPANSGGLGGFCLNLSDTAAPNSGFCIEDCGSSDAFGTGACTTTGDVCTPLNGGFSGCFPGGPNGPGETCDPNVLERGCDGVSWCQTYGDGSGVCSPYCQPDTQSNPNLGCTGGDACADAGDNLGRCRTTCTPGAEFADTTSCPAFLQTCVPADDGSAYCGASGDTALGGACAALSGECLAGDECINDWSIDQSADDPLEAGVCTQQCDPFGDNSECGSGEVCAVNFLTISREAGFCITPDEMLGSLENCAAGSRICGQASVCLDLGAGNQCAVLCDLDDSTTCAGTCNQLFNSADIRIGLCQ